MYHSCAARRWWAPSGGSFFTVAMVGVFCAAPALLWRWWASFVRLQLHCGDGGRLLCGSSFTVAIVGVFCAAPASLWRWWAPFARLHLSHLHRCLLSHAADDVSDTLVFLQIKLTLLCILHQLRQNVSAFL